MDQPLLDGVPWDEQPCVRVLTREDVPPGGRTTYCEDTPLQRCVIYLLDSPPQRNAFTRKAFPVRQKVDANNNPMYERWPRHVDGIAQAPRPLRHIPGLPDTIGSKETWLFIELLRRLDPRLEWPDIVMRMEPTLLPRTALSDRKLKNRLQNNNSRLHYPMNKMVSWHVRGPSARTMQARNNVLSSLTREQIRRNTTRGATPGLIDPSLPPTPDNQVPPAAYNQHQNKPTGERFLRVPQAQPFRATVRASPRLTSSAMVSQGRKRKRSVESEEEMQERPARSNREARTPSQIPGTVDWLNEPAHHPPTRLRPLLPRPTRSGNELVAFAAPQRRSRRRSGASEAEPADIKGKGRAPTGDEGDRHDFDQTDGGFEAAQNAAQMVPGFLPDNPFSPAYPPIPSLSGVDAPYYGANDAPQPYAPPTYDPTINSELFFQEFFEDQLNAAGASQSDGWDPYMGGWGN
ncbi:MAG: hypothetical protein Q9163_001298 [Psora crenata]